MTFIMVIGECCYLTFIMVNAALGTTRKWIVLSATDFPLKLQKADRQFHYFVLSAADVSLCSKSALLGTIMSDTWSNIQAHKKQLDSLRERLQRRRKDPSQLAIGNITQLALEAKTCTCEASVLPPYLNYYDIFWFNYILCIQHSL